MPEIQHHLRRIENYLNKAGVEIDNIEESHYEKNPLLFVKMSDIRESIGEAKYTLNSLKLKEKPK